MNEFLYGVLPYIALTIFAGGTIMRYTIYERNWTTKSSEFLSKRDLKWANPLFHIGLLMAFGGHCVGILVPKFMTEAAGTDEHMYHLMSLAGGLPAAVLFLGGFLWLCQRRFAGNDRMQVNTSGMDKLLYLVLLLTIVSGTIGTVSNIPGGFDYRETISPWFRSVLMLQPEVGLMENVPLVFQIHMLSWMMTAMLFPFTRLVHCLSFPFEYLFRSNIIYRKK
ncbi:nitrate reductase 1, gamma subunit [Selenomonas ruminantium subsp. lactilytica TAM6421]|uniref:Nitrate reductase 1, gamma subunit n=1 Tax=Selenomonas ruminantium subsp. lactilytica (strain NBRC 103574 / TAM6421) TaxID=927704 RepID=I0GUS2_SELRL|nr:respiratory nitrate reductase subunit gamma [Selenomonas ruminantium]BAL84509.1 nitrate reductase 1, gamma subunit [Selenomonas ruminantium subsp. lactilytica TAM6421]